MNSICHVPRVPAIVRKKKKPTCFFRLKPIQFSSGWYAAILNHFSCFYSLHFRTFNWTPTRFFLWSSKGGSQHILQKGWRKLCHIKGPRLHNIWTFPLFLPGCWGKTPVHLCAESLHLIPLVKCLFLLSCLGMLRTPAEGLVTSSPIRHLRDISF